MPVRPTYADSSSWLFAKGTTTQILELHRVALRQVRRLGELRGKRYDDAMPALRILRGRLIGTPVSLHGGLLSLHACLLVSGRALRDIHQPFHVDEPEKSSPSRCVDPSGCWRPLLHQHGGEKAPRLQTLFGCRQSQRRVMVATRLERAHETANGSVQAGSRLSSIEE